MKRFLWSLLLLMAFATLSAQKADGRLGELMNKSDWFALESEYPKLKGNVANEFLKPMAEALIGCYFNRTDDALRAIDELLGKYQSEIGASNAMNMLQLKATLEYYGGNYQAAAADILRLINAIRSQHLKIEDSNLESAFRLFDKAHALPAPEVIKPKADVVIPVEIVPIKMPSWVESNDYGNTILVPVIVRGHQYHFIFDTGAATSMLSTRFANEMGVKVFNDSLVIMGAGETIGKQGLIDSMQIGAVAYRNVLVSIIPYNEVLDTMQHVDAVLGMDFIKRCGEIQIFPQEKKLVIPSVYTALPSTGHNLLIKEDNNIKLRAVVNGEQRLFFFDTGNSTACFSASYYKSHQRKLDAESVREMRVRGGLGKVERKEVLRLPSCRISVGGVEANVNPIFCSIDEQSSVILPDDGNLGMSLVNQFRKVTISLKNMFLSVEK
jgi:hypothetical protein